MKSNIGHANRRPFVGLSFALVLMAPAAALAVLATWAVGTSAHNTVLAELEAGDVPPAKLVSLSTGSLSVYEIVAKDDPRLGVRLPLKTGLLALQQSEETPSPDDDDDDTTRTPGGLSV